MFHALKIVLLLAMAMAALTLGHPTPYDDHESAGSEPHGRVQIKVFRGPTEQDGLDTFAPWGYWVKQPSDDH